PTLLAAFFLCTAPPPPTSTLFPYTTLFRSIKRLTFNTASVNDEMGIEIFYDFAITPAIRFIPSYQHIWDPIAAQVSKHENGADVDRKSTRLNSSHRTISYAVFCLKKKTSPR